MTVRGFVNPPASSRQGVVRAVIGMTAAAVMVSAALIGLAGCTPADAEVVLYVSADEYVARQVVRAFEDATGQRVRMVGDTELKKTTGLVERLRSERNNPQADVFWSSEVFMTIELADEGVLEPYTSPAAAEWPARYRDAEHRWTGFAARARVIAFAPSRIGPDAVPRSWTDLTRSRFKGRIVMADPRFGTTGGHFAAMKTHWDQRNGPAYFNAFLLGLRDNEIRLLPGGNAGVVQAIIDGDADIGMTDTDDVFAAIANGADLGWVAPGHTRETARGNGTLVIPNTVGLVANAPNAEGGRRLVDYLLSETVERLLAESVSGNVPLRPGVSVDTQIDVDDALAVDFRRVAAVRSRAVAEAMTILTSRPADGEGSNALPPGRPIESVAPAALGIDDAP